MTVTFAVAAGVCAIKGALDIIAASATAHAKLAGNPVILISFLQPCSHARLEDRRTPVGCNGSEYFGCRADQRVRLGAFNRENNTLQWAKNIGTRPFLVGVAQYDELINNDRDGKAALDYAKGLKDDIVVPDITHFEMYSGKPFEISSEAAARWFTTHLK